MSDEELRRSFTLLEAQSRLECGWCFGEETCDDSVTSFEVTIGDLPMRFLPIYDPEQRKKDDECLMKAR